MLIKDALKQASLKLINNSNPLLDARILLMFVLKITYEQLIINYDNKLSDSILKKYHELIKRRENSEPIAYIVQKQEFYGLDFIVNHNVLIPRPETEMIIDEVLQNINIDNNSEIKILDLGTGSGAIAITLAKELKNSRIVATDICSTALQIAQLNAQKHEVEHQITFKVSDWYENIQNEKFDFIISNPPYISYQDSKLVAIQTNNFEPHLALYANDNGLYAYKKIIQYAVNYLKTDGKIILEIGFNQFYDVSAIINHNGFDKIVLKKDLANLPRIIIVN